jgi:glyoxylase-like metal-dependent hydrolase (beta-lactamase superfamily II)
LFAADTLMPGGVMGGVFGSGSISDYIQSLERLKGLNSKILLSGHGRLSDAPQDDVRIAIQRSHALLSDTAQLFDALDARSNFEPIMQSVRDLNKLDDG